VIGCDEEETRVEAYMDLPELIPLTVSLGLPRVLGLFELFGT